MLVLFESKSYLSSANAASTPVPISAFAGIDWRPPGKGWPGFLGCLSFPEGLVFWEPELGSICISLGLCTRGAGPDVICILCTLAVSLTYALLSYCTYRHR